MAYPILKHIQRIIGARHAADSTTLRTAYRTGQINDARGLAGVSIIDLRGYDEAEIHTAYHAYGMRARLDESNGNHDNQVIWTIPGTIVTSEIAARSFLLLDEWLTGIEADTSDRSPADKVAAHKPADATDKCLINGQEASTSPTCNGAAVPFEDAKRVAGRPDANDIVKCQLKPLDPADYAVALDAAQLDALRAAFPTGVCDWTKPGVEQQPTLPWLTFANGPGGQPLGDPPTAVRFTTRGSDPGSDLAGGSPAAAPVGPAGSRVPATGLPQGTAVVAVVALLLAAGLRRRARL